MSKLFMASLPGTLASSGMSGSYLLPLIRKVRTTEFESDKDRIKLLGDRNPGLGKLRQWVKKRSSPEDTLILSGKSLGAVKICLDVLGPDWTRYEYLRVGLLTVDPWGQRYGWHRHWGMGSIRLPAGLLSRGDGKGFWGFNVVQRNRGLKGATVAGVETLVLKDRSVRHGDIVFQPEVRDKLVELVGWALG